MVFAFDVFCRYGTTSKETLGSIKSSKYVIDLANKKEFID